MIARAGGPYPGPTPPWPDGPQPPYPGPGRLGVTVMARDARRPRGLRINADQYEAGWRAGRATGDGAKPPSSGCALLALLLLPLAPLLLLAGLALAARGRAADDSHPVGRRPEDSSGGDWHLTREEPAPTDEQITGRPWSGARHSTDEEE